MSCEICGGNGHRRDFHALADRIAKLEAVVTKLSAAAETAPPTLREQGQTPAAAGPIPPGYALAPGWQSANFGTTRCRCGATPVLVNWDLPRNCATDGVACLACAESMGAIVKAEPPAEQPASAAVEASGECGSAGPDDVTCCRDVGHDGPCTQACDRDELPVYWHKPTAPSQGAPAAPLSADFDMEHVELCAADRIRAAARAYLAGSKIFGWDGLADEVAAIEARLAAAERETDEALVSVKQAVAAERERCERWARLHLAYDTADAIRDGRPAK